MTEPSGPTIRVPRWVQLVGLPVGLLIIWMLAGVLGHVLFLFLTASVIAFLLNPLVRDLQRLRLPRGVAVALVFLIFATAVAFVGLALGSVVADQTRSATNRADEYVTVEGAGARPAPSRTSTGSSTGSTRIASSASRSRSRRPTGPTTSARGRSRTTPRTRSVRPGRRVLDRGDALQPGADRGHRHLHAAGHGATRAARSTVASLPASAYRSRCASRGARELRARAADPLDRDRAERRDRHVDPRPHGPRARGRQVRVAVRRLDGRDPGDPVHRAVALRRSARDLRPRRPSRLGLLGARPLRVHLPGRGARGRPERDGERAPAASVAGHLRPARRRRAVRHCGVLLPCRRWPPRGRSGSSSRSGCASTTGTTTASPPRGRHRARGVTWRPADVPLPR